MKPAQRILTLLVLVILFTLPAYAQFGRLGGTVLDQQGKPIRDAEIVIDRQDTGYTGHWVLKTDRQGYYSANLPVGNYKITFRMEGKDVDFINGMPVTAGIPGQGDFDMREPGKNRDGACAMMRINPAATTACQPGAISGGGGPTDAERAKNAADRAKQEAVNAAFAAGVAAAGAKNWDEAIKQFQAAASEDPEKDIIWGNLGIAFDAVKKYDDAINSYKKAIELKPTEIAYYNNLGLVYGNAGKIEDAIATLQKVGELDPASAGPAYYNLGAMLTNRGKTREASDAFKKSIELAPDNADSYYQLGISLMGTPATMAQAIPMFEKYIQLAPTDPNAEVAKQMIEAVKQMAPKE
jgi:Tfp pilus assembly protein PilF